VTSVLLAVGTAQAGPASLTDTAVDLANKARDGCCFPPSDAGPGSAPPWHRCSCQDRDWDHAATYLPDRPRVGVPGAIRHSAWWQFRPTGRMACWIQIPMPLRQDQMWL
jgi:hypothetical protein